MAKKTGMIKWDEELAKLAAKAAEQEAGVGTGENFSIKSGILSFNGNPIKDNTMGVVILDHILANANYPDKFDPQNPSGPDCFAFGRSEAELMPHKVCVDAGTARAASCGECPLNVFGSAEVGRGKACGNGRRLALISAGEFNKNGSFVTNKDPEHYKTAGIGYLKIPAASIKPFAAFVKNLQATLGRPPLGIVTRITVSPMEGGGDQVLCEPIEKLPDSVMAVILKRGQEAQGLIEFPFQAYEKRAKAPKRGAPAPRRAPAPRAADRPAPRAAARPSKPAPRAAAPVGPAKKAKF